MQILIVAATEKELEPFAAVHPGTDLLITGIGIAATIYHLQKRIQQIDYDLVIQAGIAGSFSQELKPGQTVLVCKDSFGDLGMEMNGCFSTVFEAGFGSKDEFPFTNGWLENPHTLLRSILLPIVQGVTVNKVSDNPTLKAELVRHFSPQTESMEGAALHYVCLQENLPFLQLRTISNYVGERDRGKWKMKEALENLNEELDKLVGRINS